MKLNVLTLFCCFLFICGSNQAQTKKDTTTTNEVIEKQDIYSFKVKDIAGNEFDFASLKGKKIMIVNTASKCWLTPQYLEMQTLYEQFKDFNFVIIAFPCNDFMKKEPGTEEEIAEFCEKTYGVTFPMMSKVSIKGSEKHPIFQFLTEKELNGLKDTKVQWNFQKFLINKEGYLEKVINPNLSPTDMEIVNWIQS